LPPWLRARGSFSASVIYLSDFREDRAEFDPASYMCGVSLSKLLKRLMREIQKIAIVPNVPKTEEKLL
jgi:hypothetical protein